MSNSVPVFLSENFETVCIFVLYILKRIDLFEHTKHPLLTSEPQFITFRLILFNPFYYVIMYFFSMTKLNKWAYYFSLSPRKL